MPVGGLDEADLLRLAASLERGSEHPLAAAIVDGAEARGVALADAEAFESRHRQGRARPGRRPARSRSATARCWTSWASRRATLRRAPRRCAREGQTVMFVAVDGALAGLLGVADPIKETTPEAIAQLHAEGLRIVMLTGDSRTTAEAVARKLGIDEVIADVLPDQKAAVVERLQREGRVVAMAGDGINDAPALAQAARRHRDGHRHRRRDGERRGHAGEGRPARHRAGAAAQPRDDAQHPPEPVLRVRLQRAGRARRRRRAVSRRSACC